MQQEFAKKTQVYQLLLKKLNDKVRVKKDRQRESAQKMLLRDKQLSDELLSTDSVLQNMNKKVSALESALRRTQDNNQQLREELMRNRERGEGEAEIKDEVVSMLLAASEDVRRHMVERPNEVFSGDDFAPLPNTLLPNRSV